MPLTPDEDDDILLDDAFWPRAFPAVDPRVVTYKKTNWTFDAPATWPIKAGFVPCPVNHADSGPVECVLCKGTRFVEELV